MSYTYYGVIDLSRLSTRAGDSGPLAPPEDFTGDDTTYVAMLRQRFTDPGARQHMALAARHLAGASLHADPPMIHGPYKAAARRVLLKIADA